MIDFYEIFISNLFNPNETSLHLIKICIIYIDEQNLANYYNWLDGSRQNYKLFDLRYPKVFLKMVSRWLS